MFEKQPNFAIKHPDNWTRSYQNTRTTSFDLPPNDPFASYETPEVPPKKAVEHPKGESTLSFLGNQFTHEEEPLVQQQTMAEQVSVGGADLSPRPNLQEEDPQKVKNLGGFGGPDAPVWHYCPARKGPKLWWQKDPRELNHVERWHREHPMSPAFMAPDIDNRRHKDEPKKPSHGRSEPWYEEED